MRTAAIIVRSYRDYWPLQFFGAIALGTARRAPTALGGFFLVHYARTGQFRPHTWAGVSAGACIGLAALTIHIGLIGDMLNRHRIYLEELLFRQRDAGRRPRAGRKIPAVPRDLGVQMARRRWVTNAPTTTTTVAIETAAPSHRTRGR